MPPSPARRVVDALREIVGWSLYDHASIPTTATTTTYFTSGLNNRTLWHTNVDQPSKLPEDYDFNVECLRVVPLATGIPADIRTFLTEYFLDFQIDGKSYAGGQVLQFPAGVGLDVATIVGLAAPANPPNPATGLNTVNNGLPHFGAARKFRKAIKIPNGKSFKVAITPRTTTVVGSALDVHVYFDGFLSRPVR